MLKEELTAAYAEIAKLKEEQHYPPKLINFILPSSNTSSQMQSQQSGELQTIISGNVAVGNYCAEAKRVEQGSEQETQMWTTNWNENECPLLRTWCWQMFSPETQLQH